MPAFGPIRRRDLIAALRGDLTETVRRHGGRGLVGVLSPMLACEEAYLLAKYLKSLAPDVRLALGRVPVVGSDDAYPKTRGGPSGTPKFVIHAEKCPNRRGIEDLLMSFERSIMSFDLVLSEINAGSVKAVFLTGGYPGPWLTAAEIETLTKPELVVLVDILSSAATENADYVLPGAAWAEKDGSYVNCEGLLQTTERAVRSPGHARAEGRIFWELAGRPRMYHAGDVLRELAAEVPYFADCAEGEVPEHGVRLAWGEL